MLPCHAYSAVGNMNLNTMIIENIRSFLTFAEGVPAAASDELLEHVKKGDGYWVPHGDWRVEIRKSGKKDPKMHCMISKAPLMPYEYIDKMFPLDANGLHEAIVWIKATLLDLKTRGPCPACLAGLHPCIRLRLANADFCARCCMKKILGE